MLHDSCAAKPAFSIIGEDRSAILFVANHAFDCVGAKSYGMRTRLHRSAQAAVGETPHQPDLILPDFAELAEALT
jgi:2-haloacid dehalogenase